MPKVWTETVEEHRHEVRRAILETAAGLAARHGLTSLTMSQIAAETGIGRATLYKYFPDIEAVLAATHEVQIAAHLDELAQLGGDLDDPHARLAAVLERYALIVHEHRAGDLGAALHGHEHVRRAEAHLIGFMSELLTAAVAVGEVRADVPASELARYCLRALAAAAELPSKAAVRRLVGVVLSGARPPIG